MLLLERMSDFHIYGVMLRPDWKVNGWLGPLLQPLSMVYTLTVSVSPQWRSAMEQLVPLEEQLWACSFVIEGTAEAT